MKRSGNLALLAILVSSPLGAGSFVDIANCDMATGCHLGVPATFHEDCADCLADPDDPCCHVTPFGITHPLGFTGPQVSLPLPNLCRSRGF